MTWGCEWHNLQVPKLFSVCQSSNVCFRAVHSLRCFWSCWMCTMSLCSSWSKDTMLGPSHGSEDVGSLRDCGDPQLLLCSHLWEQLLSVGATSFLLAKNPCSSQISSWELCSPSCRRGLNQHMFGGSNLTSLSCSPGAHSVCVPVLFLLQAGDSLHPHFRQQQTYP